jgi:hypothetical protein
MNKKKRVGYLYGRPVVEGDENEINAHEILAKKENDNITLAAEGGRGIKSISDVSSAEKKFGDVTYEPLITKEDIYSDKKN